jgi:RAQPRD family integrative conjugative element protein
MKTFHCLMASAFAFLILSAAPVYADTDLENAALARIVNVLNSVSPLIDEAERQQDKTARVQFQYQALRADINKIKTGIEQKLQTTSIEPRVVLPIQGDYLKQKGTHALTPSLSHRERESMK